jgi:hypothetical protein
MDVLVSMLLIIVAAKNPRVDPIAAPISRFNETFRSRASNRMIAAEAMTP